MHHKINWTKPSGIKIAGSEWPVEGARAVVGLIHGVGEHHLRYAHLADFFVSHQIAVIGYDREGFGASEGKRGHAASWSIFLDEIAWLAEECHKRYPGLPVFLYGHSMGGQLLLDYLINRPAVLTGAIASAPNIRLGFQPNRLQVALGKFMRGIYPRFAVENNLDLDRLSRTPGVKEKYLADPLVHARVSSQVGIDTLERATFLDNYTGGLPVPTLLMHGDQDGLTAHDGSRDFARRNPGTTTFRSWVGLYHELHNEPERTQVFTFVLQWLDGRLTKR